MFSSTSGRHIKRTQAFKLRLWDEWQKKSYFFSRRRIIFKPLDKSFLRELPRNKRKAPGRTAMCHPPPPPPPFCHQWNTPTRLAGYKASVHVRAPERAALVRWRRLRRCKLLSVGGCARRKKPVKQTLKKAKRLAGSWLLRHGPTSASCLSSGGVSGGMCRVMWVEAGRFARQTTRDGKEHKRRRNPTMCVIWFTVALERFWLWSLVTSFYSSICTLHMTWQRDIRSI